VVGWLGELGENFIGGFVIVIFREVSGRIFFACVISLKIFLCRLCNLHSDVFDLIF
jgi:hypothetical protein